MNRFILLALAMCGGLSHAAEPLNTEVEISAALLKIAPPCESNALKVFQKALDKYLPLLPPSVPRKRIFVHTGIKEACAKERVIEQFGVQVCVPKGAQHGTLQIKNGNAVFPISFAGNEFKLIVIPPAQIPAGGSQNEYRVIREGNKACAADIVNLDRKLAPEGRFFANAQYIGRLGYEVDLDTIRHNPNSLSAWNQFIAYAERIKGDEPLELYSLEGRSYGADYFVTDKQKYRLVITVLDKDPGKMGPTVLIQGSAKDLKEIEIIRKGFAKPFLNSLVRL